MPRGHDRYGSVPISRSTAPAYTGAAVPSDSSSPVLEIPATLPPDGRRVWYFPGAADHGHADAVVRVYRRDGSSWIACLSERNPIYGLTVSAFVLPGNDLVFLSSGVADRDDPASWRRLRMDGSPFVTWSSDRQTVVFCDGVSLEVFGRSGFLWHAYEVAELRVTDITADTIVCTAYDPSTGLDVDRRFDRLTGKDIR